MTPPPRARSGLLALAVLLLALALRTRGLGWGLPDERHHFSYHPDEYNVLRALAAMRPGELDLNPRYFHNPTLYYYACGGAWLGARLLGLAPPLDRAAFHERPGDVARLHLLGRLLSALAGAATAAAVVLALAPGRGTGAALAAGLVVALSPAHVVLSQFMDVDALLALLAALVLAAGERARTRPGRAPALLLGALVGLGAATKYNGALLAVPAAVAIVLGPPPRPRRLIALAGAAALAFVAAVPYALLDAPAFAAGLRYVLEERVAGRWSGLGHGVLFPLARTWPWLLGEPGIVLAAAGGVAVVARRRGRALPALALLAAVYASVAASGADYARYSLPALPAAAWLVAELLAGAGRLPALLLGGAVLGALGASAARTAALLRLLAGPDPRDLADAWLARLPPGARLLVPREPYFWSPPRVFMEYHYAARPEVRRAGRGALAVASAEWDAAGSAERLAASGADAVLLSESELLYPAAPGTATAGFLAELVAGGRFAEAARFDRPARLGRWLLEAPLPPPGWEYTPAGAAAVRDRRLPHDLKYLNPALLVFVPAGAGAP